MNTRFFNVAFGLLGLASLSAAAQPTVPPAPPPLAFQSAFEGYQPFVDSQQGDKPTDWKTANDTTARIGGWRAYAKEASAPAGQTTPQPAVSAAPDTPKAKP